MRTISIILALWLTVSVARAQQPPNTVDIPAPAVPATLTNGPTYQQRAPIGTHIYRPLMVVKLAPGQSFTFRRGLLPWRINYSVR